MRRTRARAKACAGQSCQTQSADRERCETPAKCPMFATHSASVRIAGATLPARRTDTRQVEQHAAMSSFATTRLMDVSATLDPADRALLNLWVNRGLDDHTLSGLTRLNPDAIAARRRTIVERLSAQLGLPPEQVDGALEDLAASSRQSIVQETNGHGAKADRAGHSNGSAGAPDLTTAKASPGPVPTSVQADPTPVPGPAPPSVMFAGQAAPSATGRRRPLIGVGLLLIALLAGIVVALASGGSRNAHAASASTPTPSPAPSSPTVSSAAPSTAAAPRAAAEPARRRVRARRRLTPLPRGRFRARGSVGLVGSGSTLRLDLNLRSVLGHATGTTKCGSMTRRSTRVRSPGYDPAATASSCACRPISATFAP
jgi:hypothetical protein